MKNIEYTLEALVAGGVQKNADGTGCASDGLDELRRQLGSLL